MRRRSTARPSGPRASTSCRSQHPGCTGDPNLTRRARRTSTSASATTAARAGHGQLLPQPPDGHHHPEPHGGSPALRQRGRGADPGVRGRGQALRHQAALPERVGPLPRHHQPDAQRGAHADRGLQHQERRQLPVERRPHAQPVQRLPGRARPPARHGHGQPRARLLRPALRARAVRPGPRAQDDGRPRVRRWCSRSTTWSATRSGCRSGG